MINPVRARIKYSFVLSALSSADSKTLFFFFFDTFIRHLKSARFFRTLSEFLYKKPSRFKLFEELLDSRKRFFNMLC